MSCCEAAVVECTLSIPAIGMSCTALTVYARWKLGPQAVLPQRNVHSPQITSPVLQDSDDFNACALL